jgi:hypothetical protein
MMHLSCAGRVVADYVVRPELALALSPRPYLHPVRTLAGVRVTDAVPRDHPWHLGLSVAIQHVEGPDGTMANFWGGRTYLPDQGYTWLEDHGRVEHVRWIARDPTAFEQELAWRVPGSPAVLREHRRMSAVPLRTSGPAGGRATGWVLRLGFDLENVTSGPVTLGSPGTQGRSGAGYGGFFWRAAASEGELRVSTPECSGEDAVHGKPSQWLIFGGNEPATGRAWSLLLAGEDDATRADPWFVRTRDYPGVGSALAFEKPIPLVPGERVGRSLLIVVLDGVLSDDAAAAVLSAARAQ